MGRWAKRECPNCEAEIRVAFSEGRFEPKVVRCPGCGSLVLVCPDGCMLEALTSLDPLKSKSFWRAHGEVADRPDKVLFFGKIGRRPSSA